MIRRDFIALIGSIAIVWSPAHAQSTDRMRRIGVMVVNAEDDPEGQIRIDAFRRGLEELGWTEGRNIRIDYRWAVSEPNSARIAATELLALAPDIILANGTPALSALHQATHSIPIVFVVVTDPVGAGYVQSLPRPGGNITGFSTFEPEIGSKWLELLNEIAPGLNRVAGILDPAFRGFAGVWRRIESLAPTFGFRATTVIFSHPDDDIESAITTFAREPRGGLIVFPTAINNKSRERIFTLAAHNRLPAVYPFRLYAISGGLMSYGFDTPDLFRRGASYVDRILKGESPAELPVQAPTRYELVINLKTARALELEIPPSLLARATEVVE